MSFQQVYYTSCASGIRGNKGFQVNAATPGLEQAILQQVERLGGYVPPVSAPTRPTPEELAQFPVSLLYHRLPGGVTMVAQAKYLGQDYSGRYGNYFTHSLLTWSPAKDLEDILPIELWRSPSFSTTESLTPALEALTGLHAGSAVDPERVQEFLRRDQRMARLPAFLTAIEAALRLRRRVVIVEEGDGVAMWLAVASYALPRHLALELTFNTYIKNPYHSDALVVGTTKDSDFSFAPHEIQHQYSVFDFLGGRFTQLTPISPFAAAVAEAYSAGHAEQIAGFLRFAEVVAPDLTLDELPIAFATYAHLAEFGVGDAIDIARWCAGRAARLDDKQLLRVFLPLFDYGMEKAALETGLALYLAAARAAEPDTSALDRPVIDWLFSVVAVEFPPTVVLDVVARVDFPTSAVTAARAFRKAWLSRLYRSDDSARLCALLLLGERLGLLQDAGKQLRRVGQDAIGPLLGDATVQDALRRIAATVEGGNLIEGVAAWLSSQVDNDAAFRALTTLRDAPRLFPLLEHYAKREQAVALWMRLIAARADGIPEGRIAAFRECVVAARECGVATNPAYLDMAFRLLWRTEKTTLAEIGQLLTILHAQRLEQTQMLSVMADSLRLSAHLGRPDPERERLAGALADAGSASAAALREGYRWMERIRTCDADATAVLPQALAAAGALGSVLGQPLVDVAVCRLSEIDYPEHIALYEQTKLASGTGFSQAYLAAVTQRLSGPKRATHAARIFAVWSRLPPRDQTSFMEEHLHRLLQGWSQAELDDVERALAPDLLALFRKWRVRHTRRSGFIGRLKAWWSLGLVALVVFVSPLFFCLPNNATGGAKVRQCDDGVSAVRTATANGWVQSKKENHRWAWTLSLGSTSGPPIRRWRTSTNAACST